MKGYEMADQLMSANSKLGENKKEISNQLWIDIRESLADAFVMGYDACLNGNEK